MSHEVTVHCPESQVTASTSWKAKTTHKSPECRVSEPSTHGPSGCPWGPRDVLVIKSIGDSWLKTVQMKLLQYESHEVLNIYLETMTSKNKKINQQ